MRKKLDLKILVNEFPVKITFINLDVKLVKMRNTYDDLDFIDDKTPVYGINAMVKIFKNDNYHDFEKLLYKYDLIDDVTYIIDGIMDDFYTNIVHSVLDKAKLKNIFNIAETEYGYRILNMDENLAFLNKEMTPYLKPVETKLKELITSIQSAILYTETNELIKKALCSKRKTKYINSYFSTPFGSVAVIKDLNADWKTKYINNGGV